MGKIKYDKQYSEELECLLSPLEAHHEWLKGSITDKSAFLCKNPKCSATFTCVNMDKISQERVNRIHFRLIGEHIPKCKLIDENSESIKNIQLNSEKKKRDFEHGIDYLILSKSPKHSHKKRQKSDDKASKIKKKRKANKDLDKKNSRDSRYYTILPMVINFLRYKSENTLENYKVKNQGKLITYKKMFFELKDMKYDYEIKDYKIFHGKSKIREVRGGYRLEFQCLFNHRGLIQKPSVYISNKAIKTGWKHIIRGNALKKFSKTGEEFHAFIYGEFDINETFINGKKVYFLVVKFPKDPFNIKKRLENINLLDFKNLK